MEEDNIKELFSSFDPELTSSDLFMSRVKNQLKAVEMIHEENERSLRRNRLAVVLASFSGFISGLVFSSLLSYIEWLLFFIRVALSDNMPQIDQLTIIEPLLAWFLVGAASVFIAVYSYEKILNLNFARIRR